MASAREPIDSQTADRLLSGRVAPDDAPPGYQRLVLALGRMRARGGPEDDAALVRAMADAITEFPAPRRKPVFKRLPMKVALASAAVLVTATGAAAASGDLPDAAQDGLANAASHIGVNLPDSASDQARESTSEVGPPAGVGKGTSPTTSVATSTTTNPDDETSPTTTPLAPTATSVPNGQTPPATNHGSVVSDTAHNADPEGGKGEEVSPVARDNHGQETREEHTPNTNGGGPPEDTPGNGPPTSLPGNANGRGRP